MYEVDVIYSMSFENKKQRNDLRQNIIILTFLSV